MTRELLLAAVVLVSGCGSGGTVPRAASSSQASSAAGITSDEAARVAPLAPSQLSAVAGAGGIRLTWPATGEDLAHFACLRRTAPTGPWQPLGQTAPTQRSYLDVNPAAGSYVYGVQAVNVAGLASPITVSGTVSIN